jgi:uncharacterized protein (TIGR03118 family)
MSSFARFLTSAALAVAAVGALTAAQAGDPGATQKNAYAVNVLVSDQPGAPWQDPNLKNPWGVAFAPGSPFWISDNNSGKSTLYDGDGTPLSLVVTIPCPKKAGEGSSCPKLAAPTGVVFNPSSDFVVPGTNSPALFIFATEDGTISAWNGSTGTNAVLIVDNSLIPNERFGAVYKGLALGVNKSGNLLFATNFRAAKVEVYDGDFKPTTTKGGFNDTKIPAGYAPFGIQNIDGDLIVTYAKQNAFKHDDMPGPGHGFVDKFDTDGNLLQRLATGGGLDSPWGVARASSAFGMFAGDLLIGNFGNGWINALTAKGLVLLDGTNGKPLHIDGLWTLTPGGGANSKPSTLYFTAGPDSEMHGRFGTIAPAQ